MTKINLFVILVSLYSAFTRYKIARAINTVSGTKRSSGPALSALEGLLFNPATAPPLLIYLILSLMVSPRILHVHPEAIFGSKMLLIISCLLQIGILAYFLTVHHRWFQSIATACHEKQIKSRINPTIALATLVGTGILPIIFAPLPLGLYWLAMTMPGFLLWWSIKSVVVRCVSVSDVQSEAENSDT